LHASDRDKWKGFVQRNAAAAETGKDFDDFDDGLGGGDSDGWASP
jgi:hypothetical protein